MATPINTIYSWFETGDFPTQAQFQASWSSFWHKDEAIPMTNISGLSDQFGKFVLGSTFNTHLSDQNAHPYFAKKDASNLTPTNVNDWKAKLGVGDLPENIATYDYDLHDHVMMKDGTTKEATDLGKNIANSSLTSIAGSGMTLGAPYAWNAANQPFSITGLPDKSADATFDRIKVQNSLGQEAIASNMYNVLFKGLTGLTAQQATNISYLLNGGIGSDGPMSVNNISPPIIQNRFDSVEYVLLRGVNLNLSAIGRRVEILAADKITVVLTIPDNQIQTSLNGQELVFYYNFYNFPIGTYYIRITSGVKQYTTELNFKIVQEIQDINTNGITWDFVYDNAYAPHSTSDTAAGASFFILPKRTDTITPVVCLKSSEIFAEGDDFYLEYRVLLTGQDQYNAKSYIGLGYSNAINNLQNNSLIYSNFSGEFIHPSFVYQIGNNSTLSANIAVGADYTVVIVKTGNLFRTIISGVNKSTVLSNNSGYSIFAAIIGRGRNQTSVACQIIKAFKFN